MPAGRGAHALQRGRSVVRRRRIEKLKVAVAVFAAGQHGRRMIQGRTRIGRRKPHGKADALLVGAIRTGAVQQVHIVQRHLASIELDVQNFARRLRSAATALARAAIARGPAVLLASRPHAAVAVATGGEGNPGGQRPLRIEPHVDAVAMPADRHRLVARMLGEQLGGPNQQIRPQQILDGIEHAVRSRQGKGPGKMQMHLANFDRPGPSTKIRLQPLAGQAVMGRLAARQDANRVDQPFRLELRPLMGRKKTRHGSLSAM